MFLMIYTFLMNSNLEEVEQTPKDDENKHRLGEMTMDSGMGSSRFE